MTKNAFAISEPSNQTMHKSKPRYTEAENKLIFESWWDPQKRRELKNHLGREMNALRSQFCRILKEKCLSNQDYYSIMQSKHLRDGNTPPRKRSHELKEIDLLILETFCRNQASGNSRTQACEELQNKLGPEFTPAALKLRFYRLVKTMQYSEADLLKMGHELLNKREKVSISADKPHNMEPKVSQEQPAKTSGGQQTTTEDQSFFYQISSLPETVRSIGERLGFIEEQQRHQLDLKGFIEHLLAVERDLKREDKLMEEIQRLVLENDNVSAMMEKEHERLKNREQELSTVYNILETMLGDFMRLESVSKLASLGDFMHRLEITVDQFGNVLKSRRIVS
ncbi:MAG TPA: hypothetical protein DDW50_12020 [Firmicutes bacterium]|nr:hypothetical protein [Bacillota bacterium]